MQAFFDKRRLACTYEVCSASCRPANRIGLILANPIWIEWYYCITFVPDKRISEGNGNVPFSFITMASETQIQTLTGMVQELLEGDDTCFLVDLWIKPTNNIRVALDADGGLPIEKCVSLNRRLYKQIEEAALYPDGDFSLEVSSPGLDEPLKMHRQYKKNISRGVEVLQLDGK